jgi:hypothetical protein
MMERSITVGSPSVLEVDGPLFPYKVVFEDDGETGYFYALDRSRPSDTQILDAVSIYDVAQMPAASKRVTVAVRWSKAGTRAALLLNDRPEAVFDFASKRGYARSNFPATSPWSLDGHAWSDSAMTGLGDQAGA